MKTLITITKGLYEGILIAISLTKVYLNNLTQILTNEITAREFKTHTKILIKPEPCNSTKLVPSYPKFSNF